MLPLSATVMRICRSFNLRRLPMRSVHFIAETPQMGIATGPGTPERTSEPRVAPSHQPIAVVLDLVNPVGAGRRTVGRRGQARLDETQNRRHSGGYIASAEPRANSCRPIGLSDGRDRAT